MLSSILSSDSLDAAVKAKSLFVSISYSDVCEAARLHQNNTP